MLFRVQSAFYLLFSFSFVVLCCFVFSSSSLVYSFVLLFFFCYVNMCSTIDQMDYVRGCWQTHRVHRESGMIAVDSIILVNRINRKREGERAFFTALYNTCTVLYIFCDQIWYVICTCSTIALTIAKYLPMRSSCRFDRILQ